MAIKLLREDCIRLLCERASLLDRLPQKSDFSEIEVMYIKSYFGPWPRALEAAGLKPSKGDERILKNREKRIRAKENRMKKKNEEKNNEES